MRRSLVSVYLILLVGLASSVYGLQRPSESRESSEPLYRLHFALHVLTGEQRETYNYETILEENEDGKIRALTKVPVRNSAGETKYVETGMSIDTEYEEKSDFVFLDVEMRFTSLSKSASEGMAHQPMIHEWECEGESILVPGQPLIVSRGEAVEEGRRYELEVSAEKLQ